MRRTNCKVSVNFIDRTALEDSTITAPANTTLNTTLSLLKNRSEYKKQFVIASYNTAILDGEATLYPAENRPYESINRGDEERWMNSQGRDFSLTYTMTDYHACSGLTFHFLDNYASEVLIRWYGDNDVLLDEKTFYPNTYVYYCPNYVENFKKVYIKFVKSDYPFCHVSLNYIDFGFVETFEGERLMSASVTEEVDATLSTIPINTFTFKIHDENGDFNPQNDKGTWRAIQKWQEVNVTEEVNGTSIDIGTFYIDSWTWENNTATFNCVSLVSFLDNNTLNFELSPGDKAVDIVDTILQQSEYYEPFDMDYDIGEIVLSGKFEDCTCREALQMVCLCVGAVCDTTRGRRLRIYKPDRNMDSIIGTDRKFFGKSSNELTDAVKSVLITYTDDETEHTITASNTTNGKTIEYSGLTIYSNSLQNVADELLEQYSLRQKAKIEYICDIEKVGEWVGIQDATNLSKIACTRIDKQTIDLTGGFIASAECTGYSTVTTELVEMGNDELIMGDNVL